jgi:poly-gamma-glutamate capsule biosynthesis protein CapA/YwtB (metallophosphatase superfamily)
MALIGLMGDVMLGRLVDEHLENVPAASIWGDLLPIMNKTDFNLANLECALTTSTEAAPKTFQFKADPKRVEALASANIKVVNLANNHILDFGSEGLFETLAVLDAAGILHVGAGKNLQEAECPVFLECDGVTVGISGFTDNEPAWRAGIHREGTAIIDPSLKFESLFLEADVNILTIHWGPNLRNTPPPQFRRFAKSAALAGIHLLHGHSAHVFQGIERIRETVVCYDTGDFVDDYAVDPVLRNDQSFFMIAEVDSLGVKALHLLPTVISEYQVNRAKDEAFTEIALRMEALSREFGTHFEWLKTGIFPYPHLRLLCRK